MSEQINLRKIFDSQVRNKLYNDLISGPLKGWEYRIVLELVQETIQANKTSIDSYLYQTNVTLLNMKEHVEKIVIEFLLPYLNKKRVQ